MANDSTVFVGLDVHKDSIVAAYSVGFGEVCGLQIEKGVQASFFSF